VPTFRNAYEKYIYFVLKTFKTLQWTRKPPENFGLPVEYMHFNAGSLTQSLLFYEELCLYHVKKRG
jgi:hypothetical protein